MGDVVTDNTHVHQYPMLLCLTHLGSALTKTPTGEANKGNSTNTLRRPP